MKRALLVVAPLLAATASCGDDSPELAAGSTATRYEVSATVLQSPDHGPQVCNAVAESYPPQCRGPDVVGWDWSLVEDEESASGTTWGVYHLVGTWDGVRFSLTEPAGPPQASSEPEVDFSTPCPEPEGGWRVVDPAKATDEALSRAMERARARPTFAGAWVDQAEEAENDPAQLVLNVRATGDLEAFEADIRDVWGGALCVSPAERTYSELEQIQSEIGGEEVLSSGIDETANAVTVQVHIADDAVQERYDTRFGEGAVNVTGWFKPVRP